MFVLVHCSESGRNTLVTPDENKRKELDRLRSVVHQLESEIAEEEGSKGFPPRQFYTEYYAAVGFLLGAFGAAASLLVNMIAAPIFGKSPMELIRVYLTFPLGETALKLSVDSKQVFAGGDGLILAIGCCLYLATGMILGAPFFVILVKLTENVSTGFRLCVAVALSVVMWIVNYYVILSWLQPLLFGGNWITDPFVLPLSVGLITHIVFGVTLALLYPWSRFEAHA